jgi:hypothetical protein
MAHELWNQFFVLLIILHGQKSSNCAGECSGCRKLLCFALQYCHASDVVMKAVCKDGEKISDYCWTATFVLFCTKRKCVLGFVLSPGDVLLKALYRLTQLFEEPRSVLERKQQRTLQAFGLGERGEIRELPCIAARRHLEVQKMLCSDLRLFWHLSAELHKEWSLHFATWATRKEVYCTARGYLIKLVFISVELLLSKPFDSRLREIHVRIERETVAL